MRMRNTNIISNIDESSLKKISGNRKFYNSEKRAYLTLKKHIPTTICFDDNKKTIIMEKINGRLLKEIIIDEEIIIKLAKALNYIHSFKKNGKHLIHGDLHKENIIYYNKEIYFVDFSCSKYGNVENDYSAFEIHITSDKKLLKIFYDNINNKYDKELIKKEKV